MLGLRCDHLTNWASRPREGSAEKRGDLTAAALDSGAHGARTSAEDEAVNGGAGFDGSGRCGRANDGGVEPASGEVRRPAGDGSVVGHLHRGLLLPVQAGDSEP